MHTINSDLEPQDTLPRFIWKRSPNSYRLWDRTWNETWTLDLKPDSEHGIEEWSLDHHVLSIPFPPEDVHPEFGLKHGPMLEKYRSLLRPHCVLAGSDLVGQSGTEGNSSSTGPTVAVVATTQQNLSESLTGAVPLAQALVIASRIEPHPQWAPTTLEVWTHIEQWLTASPGNDVIKNYHLLSRTRGLKTNVTGCRALEEMLRSHSNSTDRNLQDVVPHNGFKERVVAHTRLLEKLLDYARLSAKSEKSKTINEGFYTWHRTWEMSSALYKDSKSRVATTRDEAMDHLKGFELRLEDYPTHVVIDAAVTVSIDDFLANLSLPKQLMGQISLHPFFVSSSTDGGKFHLPILLIKHQDESCASEPTNATRNEQRVCVVSAVYFLKVLGIQDFPVYGLAICGFRAYLSQAWYSTKDNCCYILDRGITKHPFDLTTQDGVCRFVAFQSQLREHARNLQERLDTNLMEIKEVLSNASKDFGILQWSKEVQLSLLE